MLILTRNGTPRQPLLVDKSRAELVLVAGHHGVPGKALEGLEHFSHVWVLYLFHKNTDLGRLADEGFPGLRAKVRVPRLAGKKVGVLATRSPHRPTPLGLSVCKLEAVRGNKLVLSGVDLVNGTPVFDVKPYLPYVDAIPEARAPSWVQAAGEGDPMRVPTVMLGEAEEQLRLCWQRQPSSLYRSADEFLELVRQVLSFDIRSTHKRVPDGNATPSAALPTDDNELAGGAVTDLGKESGAGELSGIFRVVLEHVEVGYVIGQGRVLIKEARLLDAAQLEGYSYSSTYATGDEESVPALEDNERS
eukprot:jgi/Mesvir1/14542/Mv05231-RA.2